MCWIRWETKDWKLLRNCHTYLKISYFTIYDISVDSLFLCKKSAVEIVTVCVSFKWVFTSFYAYKMLLQLKLVVCLKWGFIIWIILKCWAIRHSSDGFKTIPILIITILQTCRNDEWIIKKVKITWVRHVI